MSTKIETLVIRNFKRVTLAEVEFGENGLTILGGGNTQGKSTFLDAIKSLIGGKKYQPSEPHNRNSGGATAVVRARLSNGIEVERSGSGSSLKVIIDGKRGKQATLNEFLNEFALDINRFMRATDAEKSKMLIEHLGIGDALEQLNKKEKALFDERTIVGREATNKRKVADTLPTYDNAPEARVNLSELITQQQTLAAENSKHNERLSHLEKVRQDGVDRRNRIAELEQQLASEQAKLEEYKVQYFEIKKETDAFTPHDLTEVESQIKNAESLNLMFDANKKAKAAADEAKASEKEQQDLTDCINETREQRQKLMESIKMPLPELSIDDGKLVYKGQLWDCMSGAERLRVSTAISRAFKPECGFVLVDELEQMDWKTIQEFDAWARNEGIQIIGAMVCDEDKASDNVIIIEDGKVKQ
jgi:predicted ATP-dependent endonuclease of OLD family